MYWTVVQNVYFFPSAWPTDVKRVKYMYLQKLSVDCMDEQNWLGRFKAMTKKLQSISIKCRWPEL